MDYAEELREIAALEAKGVLGPEMMPESWGNSWPVIELDKIPEWLKETYVSYGDDVTGPYVGEVRFYW